MAELFKSADGQERFVKWLSDDVTQALLAGADRFKRPRFPVPPDQAYGELGRVAGATEVIDFLKRPYTPPLAAGRGLPEPDYGAAALLEETQHDS